MSTRRLAMRGWRAPATTSASEAAPSGTIATMMPMAKITSCQKDTADHPADREERESDRDRKDGDHSAQVCQFLSQRDTASRLFG